MCSRAQAVRKEKKDKERARSEEEKQKRMERYKAETQVNARRVLRAVEAAGLPDEEVVPWGYSGRFTVNDIRAFAVGEFPADKYWYHSELSVESLSAPAQTAEMLGCSTDYLLGLTEELVPPAVTVRGPAGELPDTPAAALPEPVWLPGHPDKTRNVAARFVAEGLNPWVTICWYDAGTGLYHFSEDGSKIDEECSGWWPVPEEDGNGKA